MRNAPNALRSMTYGIIISCVPGRKCPIAMLSGGNEVHQESVWRKILKSWGKKPETSRIHIFRVPKLNRDAANFTEIIDWQN